MTYVAFRPLVPTESEVVAVPNNERGSTNSNSPISSQIREFLSLPKPYNRILDFNLDRQAVAFEVVFNRNLDFEILQGEKTPIVGEVVKGSTADLAGIRKGDYIVSTSATAGDSMWSHDTVEGVQSALNTRFVMSPTVTIRFERPLNVIPMEISEKIHVPYEYVVRIKRPIGLHVVEGLVPSLSDSQKEEPNRAVLVQYIKPELGAARSRRIEVGDQIVAMSASWGDRLWSVNSVESFVVGVKMRTDKQLSLKLRRMVPLKVYGGQLRGRLQRVKDRLVKREARVNASEDVNLSATSSTNVGELLDRVNNATSLLAVWKFIREADEGRMVTPFNVNKVMTAALRLERPDIAINAFESTFGFFHDPVSNPAKSLLDHISNENMVKSFVYRSGSTSKAEPLLPNPLYPNNFVATTAVKAYGRLGEPVKALSVLPWLEAGGRGGPPVAPDVYFMSALLYVCAKEKKVAEAERLFWQEIPRRNLTYTIATTNSLMYMYAKLGRPEDALKVYDLAKGLGLQCTVTTYGVLIKALMRSGKKKLEDASFEILNSLPSMGINPGVEIYNQFFEHYSKTHNFRQTKSVLRLMSSSSPKVKPDAISYGYLINCFADAKKPRSAIAAFHQMTKRRISPNAYTYMGVLKALFHMRDGLSAVQVLSEMKEKNVIPDKRHYSMAMFICVTSRQFKVAEFIFSSYLRSAEERPDTALYTLLLRSYLQQAKWTEGNRLFTQMVEGEGGVAKANSQTFNTMLQFQVPSYALVSFCSSDYHR